MRRHGYDSKDAIVACIDECLMASFARAGDDIDFDRDLIALQPEEPDFDKFPQWLHELPAKAKCLVGKHMAKNDIASDWSQSIVPSITGRASISFTSPEGDKTNHLLLLNRIGPPTRYSDLPEPIAELLAMKIFNRTGSPQLHGAHRTLLRSGLMQTSMPSLVPRIGTHVN